MHDIVEHAEPFTVETKDRLSNAVAKLVDHYAKCVTMGDHQQALRQLRSHQREQVVWDRDTVWRQMIGKARHGDQGEPRGLAARGARAARPGGRGPGRALFRKGVRRRGGAFPERPGERAPGRRLFTAPYLWCDLQSDWLWHASCEFVQHPLPLRELTADRLPGWEPTIRGLCRRACFGYPYQ